jgi:hypothetical protein
VTLAISPDDRNVYATDLFENAVSQYDVGARGRLSPKTPAKVTGLDRPEGVAVSPNGKSVYVANAGEATGSVSQFDVGPGGVLKPKSPSTVTAGVFAGELLLTPDGKTLYVTDRGANAISQYNVSKRGTLTPKSPATVATGASPVGMAITAPPPPFVLRATMSRRRFAVSPATTAAVFRYTLNENALVTITIQRLRGRRSPLRVGGAVGQPSRAGGNAVPFSGVVGGRPLRPGRYRADVVATDSFKRASVARTIPFTVSG